MAVWVKPCINPKHSTLFTLQTGLFGEVLRLLRFFRGPSRHSYERVATEVSSLQLTHLQMEHVYEVHFASGCPAVQ